MWQLGVGLGVTAVVFAGGIRACGGRSIAKAAGRVVAGSAAIGLVAGIAAPWAFENVVIESFGPGGWIRGAAFAAVALAAPVVAAMTLAANERLPAFARVLGGPPPPYPPPLAGEGREGAFVAPASGRVLVATAVLALQTARGLAFDPRYRDFTDSEPSAAVVPFPIAAAA